MLYQGIAKIVKMGNYKESEVLIREKLFAVRIECPILIAKGCGLNYEVNKKMVFTKMALQ